MKTEAWADALLKNSDMPDLPAAALLELVVDALLGVALGLLTVDEVKTLGLKLAVNEGTSKTGGDLLGLGVVVNLAYGEISHWALRR
jgi:hypothetical protein